jgi:hypothetical protein
MKKSAGQDEEREMRDDKRNFPEKTPVRGNLHSRKKHQVIRVSAALPAGELVEPVSKGGEA